MPQYLMKHSFPKIIWQTHNYKQGKLPEHISRTAATWKNLNPKWEYRYVDHEQRDEMVRAYPEIYKTYKNQKPVFQSDIWRCLVVYEHGGCYADMDSVCVKPLEYLLKDIDPFAQMVVVPMVRGNGNNHHYISKKGSIPMTKVFEQMTKYPNLLNKFTTHKIFTQTVYSDELVLPLFTVKTEHNSIEDIVAWHSHEYKDSFDPSKHTINYYGKMTNYLDFVNKNRLSLSL